MECLVGHSRSVTSTGRRPLSQARTIGNANIALQSDLHIKSLSCDGPHMQ